MADVVSNWNDLLRLRAWTPLASTRLSTTTLSDNLEKIRDGVYLWVVDSDLSGEAAHAPYITMVVWAANDGAAKRVVDGDKEADDETISSGPPRELLPETAAPEYDSIAVALRRRGDDILETAEYRIATDGAFLHKVIRSPRANYYFRSPEDQANEPPYAISHVLRS